MDYPENELSNFEKIAKHVITQGTFVYEPVLDDIGYEITCRESYLHDLKDEITRLNEVEKYDIKREKAPNEKKQNYFLEGMKLYLKGEETIENYKQILAEYKEAYSSRKAQIDNLYKEMKIIKKLRV